MSFIPTLTPAPCSPCGPQVILVGDTLFSDTEMDPKRLQRDSMEGCSPLAVGKSRCENNLTARRIDGGITKTKLPTLLSGNIQAFEPLGNHLVILSTRQ